jgi:ribosomal-protein-alanine N-acetyltransferase
MRKEDIPQVSAIDREAFPTMLPSLNFEREIRNKLTHYYVVCDDEETVETPVSADNQQKNSGFKDMLKRWFFPGDPGGSESALSSPLICGYVGFWIMADEAHITTIAVKDVFQRQGLGEMLIIAVINRARELDASVVTLEVRVSNTGAQDLYRKYGFNQTGVRKGYYTDNREDGLVMTTDDINSPVFIERFKKLVQDYREKRDIIVRDD